MESIKDIRMNQLPSENLMYTALLDRDTTYEGLFFAGIKTTGIFCRPTCSARKPKKENVEYFPNTKLALNAGYRPCKKCNPIGFKGEFPKWLKPLMDEVNDNPEERFKDNYLRNVGLDPNRVRRWFKNNHGMTFQAYLRSLRIGQAFGRIKYGESVTTTAFQSGYESLSGFTDTFKKSTGFSPSKSGTKNIINVTRILTPLGPMLAGATDKGICLLEFIDRRMLERQLTILTKRLKARILPGSSPYFDNLNTQVQEYFSGQRNKFSVPLVLIGSAFQLRIWDILQQIPYASTLSYQQVAEKMNLPHASRPVANANGANRIAIIIPCHRVIGSNGQLTGYGGGLWRKKYLLNLEKS